MNELQTKKEISVVKIVQELLIADGLQKLLSSDMEGTAAIISRKVDRVLELAPEFVEGLDRQVVINELMRRCGR